MGAGAEIGFLVAGTLSSDNPLKFLQSYANYLNKYYDINIKACFGCRILQNHMQEVLSVANKF